jgi:YHS domain-containing protein
MLRSVLYLLIAIFLITILRYFIGAILKGFSQLLQPRSPSSTRSGPGGASRAPTADELKKDPVCGTFVATATSVKKTVRGEVIYFCSNECRDKYIEGLGD